jgi:hypothetical protein
VIVYGADHASTDLHVVPGKRRACAIHNPYSLVIFGHRSILSAPSFLHSLSLPRSLPHARSLSESSPGCDGVIFGIHQAAATMAYLTRMVLRGAAPQREAKKHTALRVGLKYPVCFVVGSRRLIIKSRLDPPPHIRDISAPSQSWPLLGQAPGYIATLVPVVPAADFFLKFFPRWRP